MRSGSQARWLFTHCFTDADWEGNRALVVSFAQVWELVSLWHPHQEAGMTSNSQTLNVFIFLRPCNIQGHMRTGTDL